MNVKEMSQYCIVESGQFLLGKDIMSVNLDYARFVTLVRRVVSEYGRYKPVEHQYNINIIGLSYTFTASSTHGIPLWVSNVVPVATPNNPLGSMFLSSGNDKLSPRTHLWEYRNPVLHTTEAGQADITSAHSYVETMATGIDSVDYPGITNADTQFLDILMARFLIAVGKSRRAFTLNDLPISSDADSMVSEGKEMLDAALEAVKENSAWWLSV